LLLWKPFGQALSPINRPKNSWDQPGCQKILQALPSKADLLKMITISSKANGRKATGYFEQQISQQLA